MAQIQKIHARQILDSRDTPTIEAEVFLNDGSSGIASVPSGASTGEHEAFELRDNNNQLFNGKSVYKAIEHVHSIISPALLGMHASDQFAIDRRMIALDGTPNKSRLGANAILAVSMATAVAEAHSQGKELFQHLGSMALQPHSPFFMPHAMFNVLNGGKHAANSTDFQEYMIVPMQTESFARRLRAASEIFQALKIILSKKGFTTTVGDEGGFAPAVKTNTEGIQYLLDAIILAGYKPGQDVLLAADIAASELFDQGRYILAREGKKLEPSGMIELMQHLANTYPLVSIEDPLEENDFTGWALLTKKLGGKIQIVGDDLYTTNTERLKKGIAQKSSSAILIKLNQIGSVSETINCINLAHINGLKTVVSHRSGETDDTFIADLAVGLRCPQVKMGSLSRGERVAKYNRLLKIEELITT